MFRTADAAGITKIFLTGHTPTPIDRFDREVKEISKVALGAEKNIPWEYQTDPLKIIKDLKKDNVQIIAIEQDPRAVDYKTVNAKLPTLIIMGNEVEGISQDILDEADIIAEIPMAGEKESLNVSVSCGIALFRIFQL